MITPRHIVIKMAQFKDKERILKAARKRQLVTYRGTLPKLSTDFSAETLQARKEWDNIFKVMKGNALQPRILYLASLFFKLERETRSFTGKQEIKEFNTRKPGLRECKGTSPAGKEKAQTRNLKMTKGKISSVKANIQ